jgi:hypothetical protein
MNAWPAELVLTLPEQAVRLMCDLFEAVNQRVRELNERRIDVPPMSHDWIRRHEAICARRQEVQ